MKFAFGEDYLHLVKSHVGVVGNEIPDKTTNEGHHINRSLVLARRSQERSASVTFRHQRIFLERNCRADKQSIILEKCMR